MSVPSAFLMTLPFASVRGNSAGLTLHIRVRSAGSVFLAVSVFISESTSMRLAGVTMPTTGLPLRCTPPSSAYRFWLWTVSLARSCARRPSSFCISL